MSRQGKTASNGAVATERVNTEWYNRQQFISCFVKGGWDQVRDIMSFFIEKYFFKGDLFRSRLIVFSCLFFLLTRNDKSLFNSFNQSLSKRTYTKEQFYSMTMFLFLFLSLFQSNVQSAITQSSIFLPCNCTHALTQSIHPMACHVVFIIWQKNLRHLSCMKKKWI